MVKGLCRCDKVKDGEIFLDYPGGPNVITSILIRRTQKDKLREKIKGWKQRAERRKDAVTGAKEYMWPLEAIK